MPIELWWVTLALATDPPEASDQVSAEGITAAIEAFADVARVLTSPRCANCHPAGDAPLQGDDGVPHAMGIDRRSPAVGLPCSTCHRAEGTLDVPGLPPASPHWHLAPAAQVFEGRSPAELCAQLHDPAATGGRDPAALLDHVSHDALVLWGWSPGGDRSLPPLPHDQFVQRFTTWVSAGAPCPTDPAPDR